MTSVPPLVVARRRLLGMPLPRLAAHRAKPELILPVALLTVIAATAVWGKVAPPVNPVLTRASQQLLAPGAGHLLGTDQYGRDVFSRIIAGGSTDLLVAIVVTLISFSIGVVCGSLAGYAGGWIDDVVMRVSDVIMSFPSFLLALAITAILGNSLRNVLIAISIAYTPYFIRLTRGEMLSARTTDYAENARALGNPQWRTLILHLLPNCLGPALVQASLTMGWSVLDVAGLSFLGLGIRPPTPEWGADVGLGASNLVAGQWWTSCFPGFAILLTVVAFNLLGDALRSSYGRRRGP